MEFKLSHNDELIQISYLVYSFYSYNICLLNTYWLVYKEGQWLPPSQGVHHLVRKPGIYKQVISEKKNKQTHKLNKRIEGTHSKG